MQDDRKALVDHGWQNMQGILDIEMPIQRRNRRFFWLLFLGSMIALIVAFFFIKTHSNSTKLEQDSEIIADMVPSNAQGIETGEKEMLTPIHLDDQQNKSQISVKSGLDPVSNLSNTGPLKPPKTNNEIGSQVKETLFHQINKTQPSSYTNTFELNKAKHETNLTALDENLPVSTSITSQVSKNEHFLNKIIAENLPLQVLGLTPIPIQFEIPTLNFQQPVPVVSVKSPRIGSFRFAAKLSHLVKSKFLLVGPSLLYQHPINSKLFVHSAIGYSRAFKTNGDNSNADLSSGPPESFDPIDTNSSGQSFDNMPEPIETTDAAPTSLSILDATLALGWNFDKQWSAFAGFNVNNSFGEFPDTANLTAARAISESLQKYNRVQLGVVMGFGYSLTERINLDFEYLFNFNDFIPSELYPGINQKVGFNLKYQF